MRKILAVLGILVVGVVGVAATALYHYGMIFNPSPTEPTRERSMYEFTMKDIDGKEVPLGKYRGQVAMIVNVASKCGLTPQYEGLQALYEKYKDRGFVILGFPANNFLGQEPGTEREIKEFCSLKYNVSFPMFSKISVKGADQHPFYSFLTNPKTDPEFAGDITWNFEKFLADRDGNIIARFSPRTMPDDPELVKTLESALGTNKAD
jgi:glutathione peroxidase